MKINFIEEKKITDEANKKEEDEACRWELEKFFYSTWESLCPDSASRQRSRIGEGW